jgi:hypothetical protein
MRVRTSLIGHTLAMTLLLVFIVLPSWTGFDQELTTITSINF